MKKLLVGAYSCNPRPEGMEGSWGLSFSIAKSVNSRSNERETLSQNPSGPVIAL